MREFTLRRVVVRSLSIWGRHLPLLFALVLTVHAPRLLYLALEPTDAQPMESPDPNSGLIGFIRWIAPVYADWFGSTALRSIFTRLAEAVVIFAVYDRLHGRRPAFGTSLRGGMRRFVPVAKVALILLAIELVYGFLATWVLFTQLSDETRFELIVSSVDLSLVLRGLFLILLVPLWVAVPAAVVEGRHAIRRSVRLTRRRRLHIVALVLLVLGIDYGTTHLLVGPMIEQSRWVRFAVFRVVHDTLVLGLGAVFAVVGYHAIRLDEEGVDVSDLADVFA